MLSLAVLLVLPGLVSMQGTNTSTSTRSTDKWYGPSYRPRWWSPELYMGRAGSLAFEYGPNGPEKWGRQYPSCNGRMQSPINIEPKQLKIRWTRKPLKWESYDRLPTSMSLENSGHSMHVTGTWPSLSRAPRISGGPLEGSFVFSQLHFHWGRTDYMGSEHTVRHDRFPMEMHVVHSREDDNQLATGDRNESDEVVVVAFMFEITEKDNPALNKILDGISDVKQSKKTTTIRPFRLESLFNSFTGEYVAYKGSLTTPPCTEGVVWLISSKPLSISRNQLNTLRLSIANRSGKPIENFRPLQNIGNRSIFYLKCRNC